MTGWTLKGQYLNSLIFVLGLLTTIIGPLQHWGDIGTRFEPAAVLGYVSMIAGFLRSINTERPRDSFRERPGESGAKKPPDTDPTVETAPLFKETP